MPSIDEDNAGATNFDLDERKIEFIDFDESSADQSLVNAIHNAPSSLGFDFNHETRLLCTEVSQVRVVTTACAVELFGLDTTNLSDFDEAIFRIDYKTWFGPYQFDVQDPETISRRDEHIYIKKSVLLAGEAASYGLGPEYGFEEWFDDELVTGSLEQVEYPTNLRQDRIDELVNEAKTEARDSIAEYLDGDDESIPLGLNPALEAVYKAIAAETREETEAAEALERRKVQEIEVNGHHWKIDTITFSAGEDWVQLSIDAWDDWSAERHYLTAKLSFSASGATTQEVEIKEWRIRNGYGLKKMTFAAMPAPTQQSEAEASLRALAESGWLGRQFDS